MQKIKSLYRLARGEKGQMLATPDVVEGSEWVLAGEGMAMRKWDGTPVVLMETGLHKRYDCKTGKPPEGFIPCCEPSDGHWTGWVKCSITNPADKYIMEPYLTFLRTPDETNFFVQGMFRGDTMECCGPKINGNPEGLSRHTYMNHREQEIYPSCPTGFDELKEWFLGKDIEGVVWHHKSHDGRMVKMTKKYYGLRRDA